MPTDSFQLVSSSVSIVQYKEGLKVLTLYDLVWDQCSTQGPINIDTFPNSLILLFLKKFTEVYKCNISPHTVFPKRTRQKVFVHKNKASLQLRSFI